MKTSENASLEKWPICPADLEQLKSQAESLSLTLETSEDVSILTKPVKIGRFELPNAMVIHPMEGCDGKSDGVPDELTLRRYTRFAEGGAGMIWVEAIAVTPEGRANPRQLWITGENVGEFKKLVDLIRQKSQDKFGANHRVMIVAQLTHSGRYSKPDGTPKPLITQHCEYRDAKSHIEKNDPVVSDQYLDDLVPKYAQAASLAFEAGFDAVDVKACHGYLINELLGSFTREGKYGGVFENRTRLLLDVVDAINSKCKVADGVTTRIGVYDAVAYPFGWGVDKQDYKTPDLTEPLKLLEQLQDRGVRMASVTAANPYYNPHVNRPFDKPAIGAYESPEHPLNGVVRLIELGGRIQKHLPDMSIVSAGYSWLRTLMSHVAAGVIQSGKAKLVGAGRLGFAYPDFPADIIKSGKLDPKKVCISCSACTQIMRDGGKTGCVIRDAEVYGPIYKECRKKEANNAS